MAAGIAIGTPQYGGRRKNNFRLQDGSNVYRILPPLGELATEGVWAVYDSLHWGYKGSKGMRPFKCIQKKDFKTKMIKVQCPECDKIAERQATYDDQMKALEAQGKSKEEAREYLKPLGDWLYSHNLDKKWYVNALAPDGKIGRLAIPHKMYVQLQEVIADLVSKQGVDPIGVDGGVWFDLIRTGKGNQTAHRVAVVEQVEVVNGRSMRVYKPAPLTQDVISRLSSEAYDLKNAVRVLSYDEIKSIVTSGGDPEVVDALFGSGEVRERATEAPTDDEPENGAVASTNAAMRTIPAAPSEPAPVAAPTPVTAAAEDPAAAMKAQFEAQMKAMQEEFARKLAAATTAAPAVATPVATPATTAAPTPGPTPTASTAPAPATTMTDDDFISQFGFNKK